MTDLPAWGVLALSCLCAMLLGFTAHRANICMVRAAAEIMSARTIHMLWSITKSMLWVVLMTLPFFVLVHMADHTGWSANGVAVAGGFCFGLGAAMNGGCSFSTMTRIVDGEVGKLFTLAGFAVGVVALEILSHEMWVPRPQQAPAGVGVAARYAIIILPILLLWAAYELNRIWTSRTRGKRLIDLIFAKQYRLSVAAILIGVGSSGLFLLTGTPGYTVTVQSAVNTAIDMGLSPSTLRWVLLAAMISGIALSTWQRGSFRLDWRPQPAWLRYFVGGTLMGVGAFMAPGGNDAIILYGAPTLSPHAVPALVALLGGAIAGLAIVRQFGINCNVLCRNDIFLLEDQPAASVLKGNKPSAT